MHIAKTSGRPWMECYLILLLFAQPDRVEEAKGSEEAA